MLAAVLLTSIHGQLQVLQASDKSEYWYGTPTCTRSIRLTLHA